MLTPSQYTALLRKKWIDYLSASVELRDEKNVKLEAFLNKILYIQEKYKFEKCPEFSDLTSCGNILTSQFLTDVHQVCTECSMESEDVTPLIHYLLEGRGWKILWLIKFVGVQSLHSNQDLAKLLLSLFPLYNQFNLYSLSQNYSACSFADKHTYDNIESCFQAYIRNRTQALFSQKRSRDKGSPRFKKRTPIDYRKTSSFKIHIGTIESSDSDCIITNHDKKEQLVQYRQNPMDFLYFSKANVKSSDELDSDDTMSLEEKMQIQELGKRSISFVQFCESVISLLQKICLEDEIANNKTQLCTPVSAEVLPFALSMFASVHEDCGYVGNWSPRDAYRIKQQLLFLIFTSASSLVCVPDGIYVLDQHCVIQHLLAIVESTQLSAVVTESKSSDSFITKEESLLLNFNVVCGCLMLMCILNEQCLARQDFEGLLKGIHFSSNQRQIIANGLAMYESCYEENSRVCNRITQLIHMVTQSVALMKSKRVVNWHVKECNKLRHKRCNFKIYNHHHHDTFGVWKNECSSDEEQLCCIANFLTVLLEIYQMSISVNTHALILNSFKRVGLCCCLQVDVVLNSLLSCLQIQSPRLRQSVFNFVETTVLEQLTGSTNFAATLQFCTVCRCKYETTTSMLKIVQDSVNNSEPITVLELNTILNDNVTVWGAVKLYCDIVFANDMSILVHQIEKHVLQLCLSGNQLVGIEIFLRVVIPIFLNAQVSSKENNHLITWCLTAFSILLKHSALAEIFLKLSGLELLKRYLTIAAFRALVLRILHVLVIVEVDKVDDSVKMTDLVSLRGFETILLDLCADIIADTKLNESTKDTDDSVVCKIPTQAQLEYQCDIWSSGMSLISKSRTCKIYFRNGAVSETAYKLLVKLLQIMSQEEFSSVMTISDRLLARRFLKSALNLLEVLLAFCLRICPFVVAGTQLINETEVNEILKKYVFSFVLWHPDDLRLLMESLTNAVQETPARMKRKTELLYLEAYLPSCEETDFQDIELDTSAQAIHDKSFSQLDEGYEADVELPDLITEQQENPLSIADNQLIYMDVMEIVLEILKRMAQEQSAVVEPNDLGIRALTSIINRLVSLCRDNFNNCLGLYNHNILMIILQDFRKFFFDTNNSLRELQSNLLDLFVIIGKQSINCEVLSLFISLFKQCDPPMDLLLAAFSQLTTNVSSEPECFLCFPSNAQKYTFNEHIISRAEAVLSNDDNSAASSIDVKLERNLGANTIIADPNTEIVRTISVEHSEHNILSPWSKATCIIPIHNAPEISLNSKFSFSLWLKTCAPGRQFFSRGQHQRQTCEKIKMKEREVKYARDNLNDSSVDTSGVFTSEVSDNDENFNSYVSTQALHLVSFGESSNLFEIWSLPAFESLVVRLTTNNNRRYSIVSESLCKSLLKLDQWHHLSVNYYTEQKDKKIFAKVKIIVDGYISDGVALELKNVGADKTNSLNILLLGHEAITDEIGSLSWYLGYFALLKDLVLELDVNLAISALGPNDTNFFSNITDTERVNFPIQPIRKFLKTGLSPTLLQKAFNAQLSHLQDVIILLYTPHSSRYATRYYNTIASQSDISRERKSTQQTSEIISVFRLNDLKVLSKNTVDSAISQLGGVSAMLLLLCRVVECCSQEDIQANAISLVLRFVGSTSRYRTDFLNLSGPSLLTKIFSARQFCGKYLTLKAITDACLSTPVLLGDYLRKQPIFSQNTNAVILDAEVLTSSLMLWKTWEKDDVHIQNTFFLVIKELISDAHPYHNFNRRQFAPNFISIILSSFKERFIEDRLAMPKDTCHLIISLMGTMLTYPPDSSLLRSIFDFLLLAHPAANTHLSDDGYNFYFSLHPSARFGPITIAVSSGLDGSEESSPKPVEQSITKSSSNKTAASSTEESAPTEDVLVDKVSQLQFEDAQSNDISDVSESMEYNTAAAECANGDNSRSEGTVPNKQNKKQLNKNNAVQIVATSNTDNLRLLYMNSAGTSNSTTHYCPAIGEARTFYQDYEIIHDVYNVSSPEIISGPEDGSASEEWEVLTVLESEDVCVQSCREQNYLVILCSGLLNMLLQLLENSPDRMRDAISSSVIRAEELLVLANNSNNNIRTAVVKLLHAYLNYATEEKLNLFFKMKGFIILANQIRRHTANSNLVEASLSLMLDRNFTFENYKIETVNISKSVQQSSAALILAILPTLTNDTALCHNLLNFLLQVFIMYPDVIQTFIDNALLEVIIQVIANIVNSESRVTDLIHSEEQDLLCDDIKKVLEQISISAVSFESCVHKVTLDDLLALLSCLEIREFKHQHRGKRSVQKIRYLKCSCAQSAIDRLYQLSLVEDRSTTSKYLAALRMPFPSESGTSSGKPLRTKIPQSQVVEYLHILLTKCVDFLVYSDDAIPASNYEKCFTRYVTQLLLQLDCSLSSSKSTMRSAKQGIKLQLLRLLVYLLSPVQSVDQRLFAVTVIMKEQRPKNLLRSVLRANGLLRDMFCAALQDLSSNGTAQILEEESKTCRQLMAIVHSLNSPSPEFAPNWFHESERKKVWLLACERQENKILSRRDNLISTVCESAKTITRSIIITQNKVRKDFLAVVKASHGEQIQIRSMWGKIVSKLTHERAIWHYPESYPQSWQLHFTEGPHRERRRLQRSHLYLDRRYLLPEQRSKLDAATHPEPFHFLSETEVLSFGCPALVDCLHANEEIRYTSPCTIITPSSDASGDIVIGNVCLYFIGEDLKSNSLNEQLDDLVLLKWMFVDIKEIISRRYELQDNAIEIFLLNGETYLLSFQTRKDRECFHQYLMTSPLPNLIYTQELAVITQHWQDGSLTNFDYLMHLNKLAGRSFNDLMQYPIFPFVLSNYTGVTLNHLDPQNFRNLSKPMAIQEKKREQHYLNTYQYWKVEQRKGGSFSEEMMPVMEPYHYGSHYSNSITVLYFLVRLPPFTGIFLKYQDRNFDIPDRSFHSINTTWRLSSSESNTDMKELIPEMFFLPEILKNFEGFDFGIRQSGERVEDVILPPWCRNDPRLFVLINRQALESDYVTEHLCEWIDLIFGYKQTGKAAVEAINVFHPTTYYGFKLDTISDPIQQAALKTMIRTLGQTPLQLFQSAHPMVTISILGDKKTANYKNLPLVLPEVQGLKWGRYVGSPASDGPVLLRKSLENPCVKSFVALKTNDVFGLAENRCLILSYSKENVNVSYTTYVSTSALITWGHIDGNIRIKWRRDQKSCVLIKGALNDPVVCCNAVSESPVLFVGHHSGIVVAYEMDFDANKSTVKMIKQPTWLYGHTAAITSLNICWPYGILVSASLDGTCIVWDLNSLSYTRSITNTTLRLIAVSGTTGDMALVSDSDNGNALQLYGINCNLIGEISMSMLIHSLCFSSAPEGISVNVIATGMANGQIKLWSTWDLTAVSIIQIENFTHPIISLTYAADSQLLYATNNEGVLVVWENEYKASGKPLKYQTLF